MNFNNLGLLYSHLKSVWAFFIQLQVDYPDNMAIQRLETTQAKITNYVDGLLLEKPIYSTIPVHQFRIEARNPISLIEDIDEKWTSIFPKLINSTEDSENLKSELREIIHSVETLFKIAKFFILNNLPVPNENNACEVTRYQFKRDALKDEIKNSFYYPLAPGN